MKSEGIPNQVGKSRGNEIDRQNQEILFEWNDKVILKYGMGEASDYLKYGLEMKHQSSALFMVLF